MGKFGVPDRNVSGDRLLEMCSEMELVIRNTFFRKKGINVFTWQRIDNGRLVERAMRDYVLVEKNDLGRLVDVLVARGAEGGVSDYLLVVAKVRGGIDFRRRREQEYAEKVRMAYERTEQQKITTIEEEWKIFRGFRYFFHNSF